MKINWIDPNAPVLAKLREVQRLNLEDRQGCHYLSDRQHELASARREAEEKYAQNPGAETAKALQKIDADTESAKKLFGSTNQRTHILAYERIAERTREPYRAALEYKLKSLEADRATLLADMENNAARFGWTQERITEMRNQITGTIEAEMSGARAHSQDVQKFSGERLITYVANLLAQ